MNKENIRRRIRNVTAFAAALLLAAAFTFPAELGDGFFDGFGNAIVASAAGSSGTCGTKLTWTFDGTDTLTISGTGEMANWKSSSEVPWKSYSDSIKSVVIENGVTYIGNHAFESHRHLESVAISDSVTSIGENAFCSCMDLTSITIPDSVKFIGRTVFFNCTNLESIFLPNTLDFFGLGLFDTTTRIKYTVDNKSVTITSVTLGSGQTSVTIPETIDGKNVTAVCIKDGITGIDVPASATQIKYTVDNSNNVTITGAKPGEGVTSVTIPDTIDGKTVTSIRNNAFKNRSILTSITIPDSVTSIGDSAFESCTSLTSITIPNSVNSIGSYAFDNCTSLKSITIPSSVNSIGSGAFEYCASLESITIPYSVTSIGHHTFYGCTSLTSITIPSSVNSIGSYAFRSCENLTSITIPGSVNSIGNYTFKKCSNLTSIFLPERLTSIGTDAIPASATQVKYTVTDDKVTIKKVTLGSGQTSVTIPETIDGKPVTVVYIRDGATGIAVPASATQIKYTVDNENVIATVAALGKGQTSVTIPETIDGKAVTVVFTKDETNISAPSSATQIKYTVDDSNNVTITGATLGKGVSSVTIPETIDGKTVTSIGDSAFLECLKLTSITIPSGVTSISYDAFSCCSDLTSITIPDSVTSIGGYAFSYCRSLKSITIPDSVTSIERGAFYNCSSLESITIPDGVTSIGENAFTFCTSLTSITIPNSVNSIGFCAFDGCTSLTSITIPNGVTSIGENAFSRCSSLGSITIPDSVTSIGTDAIPASATQIKYTVSGDNVTVTGVTLGSGQTSVTIPDTIDGKAVTVVFTKDGTNISAPSSATQIKYTVTDDKVTIKKVTLGEGQTSLTIPDTIDGKTVTSIGITAFKDCTSLASITIPNGVTSIGDSAFRSCTNLTSLTIPDSVNSIGNFAFRSCTNLTSLTIPDSVNSIGEYAFYYCTSLKSITIPGSVNSIGNNAFKSCSSLASIFLPERLTSIGTDAIPTSAAQIKYTVDNENVTITSVTLGSGQTSVTIPDTIGGKAVTNIADGALASCPNVTHEHREKKAATCTAKAVCAICETEYGETEAHSLNKHDAVPASCTTNGNIEYYECNLCDKLFADESGTTEVTLEEITIAAHHSFGEDWEGDKDNHWHICTVCGEQSASEAHIKDNGTVTKEATLTENGTITYKCTVCGADMGEETITATISSFEVTSSGVVVKYTVTGSTEVNSQTLKFSEVTEEMVELMKSKDIKLVIDFVNYSTAGSDTIILTAAQMKAIDYVLAHDLGM